MRLIDADAIECNKECQHCQFSNAYNFVDGCDLFEQPTAYDIDKVVEEINEESWEYMSDFGDTRVIDFADAIDIVRRGGVDGQDKRSCD